MNSAKEMRNTLAEVFAELRNGSIDVAVASELANIAGKMISSAKTQCTYYELRQEKPSISFLDE